MSASEIVAVSVGNTRTRIGVFRAGSLEHAQAVPSAGAEAAAEAILGAPVQSPSSPVVVASVNPRASGAIVRAALAAIEGRGGEVYELGKDLEIPIERALEDDSTVGQDRLLNALAGFRRARQACVVIDAGTAVTVDFVDGTGVFQGGAIAPGLGLMLAALRQGTAALPEVAFERVGADRPFGKHTVEAMRLGVQSAVRGMARHLVERYAEFYGAYPQVVATGGDAAALFEGDDVVEHIVPDLTLMGIEAACAIQLAGEDEEPGGGAAG